MARRTNENTRRFRRQTLRVLVDYSTENGVCCDYATTLGAGGMFLETHEELTRGASIKTRFKLTGSDILHEIEGRVVWFRPAAQSGEPVRAGGAGIRFTDAEAVSRLGRELEDYEF